MSYSISRILVFLFAASFSFTAFADGGNHEITGRTCKQHLATGVLSQTWASLLTSQHDIESPRETAISELAAIEVGVGTSIGVRAMVRAANNVIDQCEQHCSGLRGANNRLFNCERIGEANSNQLHAFSNGDRHMADDATTELTQEQLTALFDDGDDDSAAEEVEEETTPEVVVEDVRPQSEDADTDVRAYRHHWTNKVGQGQETLIEL